MPISRSILDAIEESLSSDVTRHPSINRVLKQLPQFITAGDDPVKVRKIWDSVSQDLAKLVRDGGILDRKLLDSLADEVVTVAAVPKENDYEALRGLVGEITKSRQSDISTLLFPGLPPRFREGVNTAFTLRALALHPRRVLPPDKSLLSLFMQEPDHKTEEERKKEQAITDVIKQAYWDSALEEISSPESEIHIPRIKAFYHDLFDALRPFVNRNHPLLVSLSSPMSPSSNPLASATNYLRASLALMRTLCAPVRDDEIDAALATLDGVDRLHASRQELAKAYISAMKVALEMSQTMVDDRQSAITQYGDETNVKAILRATAREEEKTAIINAFGMDKSKASWKEWTRSLTGPHGWTSKLIDVVSGLDPLMVNSELLPPILQMHRVELGEAQSLLLGVIIAGCIRTLVPALPAGRQTLLYHDNQDALDIEAHFMERLWDLLGADPFNSPEGFKESDLDNLSVEVTRLWKQRNPNITDSSAKEKELDDMVKRMVNDEAHPVRLLLKKRVVDALKERLSHSMVAVDQAAPSTVAAGRGLQQQRLKLKSGKPFVWDEPEPDMTVMGFTDPELKKHLRQVVHILRLVEGWVEYVWQDDIL